MLIETIAPAVCWRPYPEPENPEQIADAFDVFWSEYEAVTEWTAARGLPQPSLDDFLVLIAAAWNHLDAWIPSGPPH
jgi:hypothetical protein